MIDYIAHSSSNCCFEKLDCGHNIPMHLVGNVFKLSWIGKYKNLKKHRNGLETNKKTKTKCYQTYLFLIDVLALVIYIFENKNKKL